MKKEKRAASSGSDFDFPAFRVNSTCVPNLIHIVCPLKTRVKNFIYTEIVIDPINMDMSIRSRDIQLTLDVIL